MCVCVCVLSKVTLQERQSDGLFFPKSGLKFVLSAAGWPTPL